MLQATDIWTRVGYSTIDGVNVVQYTCQIPLAKPEGMTVRRSVLNQKLYEEHRDEFRADFATFEDESYATRDRIVNKSQE